MYVLLSITFVFQGMNKLNPMGTTRSALFAVGSVLILLFFGQRWFSNSAKKATTWPPTINMCPDYLTYVPNVSGSISNSGGGCVDLLGVSTKASFTVTQASAIATGLTYAPGSNTIFPYTSDDVNTTNVEEICNACKTNGLTWEGVYDGDTCLGLNRSQSISEKQDACMNDN